MDLHPGFTGLGLIHLAESFCGGGISYLPFLEAITLQSND